jgi:hypothetical protein
VVYKGVMIATTAIIGIFNTVASLATIRMTAMALAEDVATAATLALDAAMMLTPWGIIAAGIGIVAGAYLLAANNADKLKKSDLVWDAKTGTMRVREHNESVAGAGAPSRSLKQYFNGYKKPAIGGIATVAGQNMVPLVTPVHLSFSGALAQMPLLRQLINTEPGLSKAAKGAKDAAGDNATGDDGVSSGAITGGGSRKIILNVHKGAIDFKINVKDMAQALEVSEEKLDELLLRWLYSAKAAM